VHPLRNTLAVITTIALVACACGGVSQGLTTPGALALQAGTTIEADNAISVVFHRALDMATLPGNVVATQSGNGVPLQYGLLDDGYVLNIRSMYYLWHEGELEITLVGGEQGIRYADGRGFDSITLVYFVGN